MSLNKTVGLFSASQIIVWATMYYMFPAMLLAWEENTGWSRTELSIGYALALAASALSGPVVGKLIDLGSARYCMTGGACLGAVSLGILSTVTEVWQFYLVWTVLGIAIAFTHYEACFIVLTKYMGTRSRTAITRVTLIAGFAGMIAFPAAHLLNARIGWQFTLQVYALVVLFAGAPLLWLGCRHAEGFDRPQPAGETATPAPTFRTIGNSRFWLLSLAFGLIALDHGVVISHILPILSEKGLGLETAVFVASMIGPMQVVGRLGMFAAESRLPLLTITIVSYLGMIAAAFCLLGVAAIPLLAFVFMLLQGAGYGVTSILKPVVTAELLGRQNFGVISGLLTIPYMAGLAVAPAFAAVLWEMGGYNLVLISITIGLVIGLMAMNLAWRRPA